MTGSNCRHPRCKRGALPTELIARRDVPIGHFRQASSHHAVPAFGGGEEKSHRLRRLLGQRSEEHTSELQSLMRISYAVFCLKKKTNNQTTAIRQTHTTT